MQISVVIPLFNEAESLPELVSWIDIVMKRNQFTYEMVLVDDGSTDDSWQVIRQLRQSYISIKAIRFKRNYGKSAALNEGFIAASGDVVITMDADLQDSPDEIPELYRMIVEDKYDLVSGWKKKRYDPISKTIPTKLYNAVTRRISGIKLHDFNCGLKAYDRKVVKSIEVIGEMHRYIPVMAKWAGFRRIGEKVVQHRERKYGVTKFGLGRFINGPLDLLSIIFVSRFSKKPMHFFGLFGSLFIFLGFVILFILSFQKLFFDVSGIASRPLFYFGILTFIVGTQFFTTGFLAEMALRQAPTRNQYLVDEKIGLDANMID
ncbi:MAG TPA: glycosyltransferase [Saprospirales bacterium]|nr:glycosyltransferase [Saprospirales bacterium]HAY70415.1 glycosyltransferase [Saprospirales bacterium]HRQ31061.1 glycosyltransferase family 2 protein [Saprospiraceae bacterium]